jgi:hypothetical protein
MMRRSLVCTFALLACFALETASADLPRLDNYARGAQIEAVPVRPIMQLALTDAVYRGVVTDDLSDVRVFNADGVPVPHALCPPPSQPPTIAQQTLPVYRLRETPVRTGDGTRVEVQTPSGAQISVEGTLDTARANDAGYVIDAREIDDELRAVQFFWSSPDGASEARVRIQASEDLDGWRTIVAESTLVQVAAADRRLQRQRVAIPQARYRYLRVARIDGGPALQIDGVVAERVVPPAFVEPMWFDAAMATSEPSALEFSSDRHAPIAFARLRFAQPNVSMQVVIESRAEPKANWVTRWTGEMFEIVNGDGYRVSPPAEFAPTTHRHWRVRLLKDNDVFYEQPRLELGYRPAQLRFLAQGSGPYLLAFGSRRADPAPVRACNSLLSGLSEAELEQNMGMAYLGADRALGGDAALRPLPKKTPVRQIVLWSVLILGVGVLVAMALSLLRRVNADPTKNSP